MSENSHRRLEEIASELREHPKLVVVEDYELAMQHLVNHSAKYRNGEAAGVASDERYWMSLRIIHRNRPGRSLLVGDGSIDGLVEAAFEAAECSEPDPWFRFPIWRRQEFESGEIKERSPEALESQFTQLSATADLIEEHLELWETETHLSRKQEKRQLYYATSYETARLSVLNRTDEGLIWLKREISSKHQPRLRMESLKSLVAQAATFERSEPFSGEVKGRCFFSPEAACTLLKKMAPWFSAEAVQEEESPLRHLQGKKLAPPILNLFDDGRRIESAHFSPFDMEGVATQTTALIENGTLKQFLYDTYSGTRDNRTSTGNLVRRYSQDRPHIGSTTLFVKEGTEDPRDWLTRMGEGILIEAIESMESDSPASPEVLVRGVGWKIGKSGCEAPIRDIQFKMNLIRVWERLLGIGNDQAFFGSVGSPSILFDVLP